MKTKKNDETINLITKNVFVDTSIFVAENFFHGSKIQSLFHYSRIGVINLHMTTISKMELLNRFSKQLSDCIGEMKKVQKSFNEKELRIIKNLQVYDKFTIPTIHITSHYNELERKLQNLIKTSKINIISSTNIDVEKIFKDYFSSKPPFGSGQKKTEFPDAFIIGSLESWCKANNEKLYVLSNDKDFLSYKSDNLILVKNVNEYLSMLSEYYDKEFFMKRTLKTKQIIESRIEELQTLINDEIIGKITIKTDKEIITLFHAQKVKFEKYHVISIRDEYTEVELLFNLALQFILEPKVDDFRNSIFEDNIKQKIITVNTIIPVVIEVGGIEQIKLKWINDGNDITIFYNNGE